MSVVLYVEKGGLKRSVCHCPCRVSTLPTPRRACCVKACYAVLKFILESGAKDFEVVVSGKLQGKSAKTIKFVDVLRMTVEIPLTTVLTLLCAICFSDMVCWVSKQRSCCSVTQVVRSALGSLCLPTWASWNLKVKFYSPLPSQNRMVGSQSQLPRTSQCLHLNRVLAAASGGWMLPCKDI